LTTVYVAAHKPYEIAPESVYSPVHVGHTSAKNDIGFLGDDAGHNISQKNENYCELTAIFWAAYNSSDDRIGLVHYRRYFAGSGWRGTATGAEIDLWLSSADIVVPRPRNYVIETIRSHYARAHHESDLDAARAAVATLTPEYLPSFDAIMNGRRLSLYNMFITRAELLREYADWVFPLLEETEKTIPVESYGPQQARVFGYLGERLFNVWLHHNSERILVRHIKVVNLEGENLIKKGWGMLRRRTGAGRVS
jgi:hypothetical protein